MFGKKKNEEPLFNYDPKKHKAILRCSICNGEQVAGFKNIETGEVTEICLIHDSLELDAFMEQYNVGTITKVY